MNGASKDMTVKSVTVAKKRLAADVSEQYHKKVCIIAAARGQSVQELMVESLNHYFGVIESEVSSELEKVA